MQSESLKTSIPFVSYITHTSGISVIAVFIVRTLISIITPIKFALITFFLPYVTSAQLYQLLQGIANAVQLSYIIFYQASTSRVTEFKSAKHGEIRQWPHLDL